ncbi:hypothetical protein ACLOJK_027625 [Asimina triloba]
MMASYGGAAMMSVQELSRDGADPPQPFIWRQNQERPIDASPPTSPIPTVDLELLFSSDGDSRMGEMEKLLSALKSWGFRRKRDGQLILQVMGGGRIVKDEIKHPRQVAVEAEHMGVEQLVCQNSEPWSEAINEKGLRLIFSRKNPLANAFVGEHYYPSKHWTIPNNQALARAQAEGIICSRSIKSCSAVGHGIPTSLMDDVGKVSREYFDLPKEEKENFSKAVFKEGDENDEIASKDEIRDWCDHLYLLVLPEDERDMSLWPDNPCELRYLFFKKITLEILSEYTKKVKSVIEVTLKAIGKLLDLEEDYFLKQFDDKAAAYARFNYYPSCSKPDLVHGLKPHSDGSGITILLPDQTVEGLEVCKDGKWVKVNALPYALIINVGDQMEVGVLYEAPPPPTLATGLGFIIWMFTYSTYMCYMAMGLITRVARV